MSLKKDEWKKLEKKAYDLRKICCDTTKWAGSGHIGGSLSAIDVLTLIYYKYANFDPKNVDDKNRDRIVVSKGHMGIGLAGLYADLGLVDKKELHNFNKFGSPLGMHLNHHYVKGLDASTGSLGHGSPIALGYALGARVQNQDYKVFLLLGDGECDEGSVWEAAMATTHYNATNLITMVDRNHNMIDGNTEDVMKLEPFADKWKAFGFETYVVDGHNMNEISTAIEKALKAKDKPVCIILDTVKGEGIDYMAGNYLWHYGAMDDDGYNKAIKSLDEHYKKRLERIEKEGK